ncbi:MAG: DUF86 domain-containing protein [Burkholderiaceae bacterium]|nr:DUF86 domain-containing protein [Burkholderiaceae bacterium]
MSRSWLLYLDDLIASAEKIERMTSGRNFEQFVAEEAIFDAVLFNLQVIGEAVKKLPDEARVLFTDAHRSAPARLRDLIAHHYFALDPDIVWEVARRHIPALLGEARVLRLRIDGPSMPTDSA